MMNGNLDIGEFWETIVHSYLKGNKLKILKLVAIGKKNNVAPSVCSLFKLSSSKPNLQHLMNCVILFLDQNTIRIVCPRK